MNYCDLTVVHAGQNSEVMVADPLYAASTSGYDACPRRCIRAKSV